MWQTYRLTWINVTPVVFAIFIDIQACDGSMKSKKAMCV